MRVWLFYKRLTYKKSIFLIQRIQVNLGCWWLYNSGTFCRRLFFLEKTAFCILISAVIRILIIWLTVTPFVLGKLFLQFVSILLRRDKKSKFLVFYSSIIKYHVFWLNTIFRKIRNLDSFLSSFTTVAVFWNSDVAFCGR